MIQNEREIRHEYVLQAVRQMMTAARTAPKGKGIDITGKWRTGFHWRFNEHSFL